MCITVMPAKHCQKHFVIVLSKLGKINACLYAYQSPPLGFASDTRTIIPLYKTFTICMIPITYLVPCSKAEHHLIIWGRDAYHVVITVGEISVFSSMYFYVHIPMDPLYEHKTGTLNNMKGGRGLKTIFNLHSN